MKDRFVVEMVFKEISECGSCCSNCMCKKLAEYINNIGFEEFYKKYISSNLPEDMAFILESKIRAMSL